VGVSPERRGGGRKSSGAGRKKGLGCREEAMPMEHGPPSMGHAARDMQHGPCSIVRPPRGHVGRAMLHASHGPGGKGQECSRRVNG
jgi:hypothetical protein